MIPDGYDPQHVTIDKEGLHVRALTTVMQEPVLRLLLAAAGVDDASLPVAPAWAVFKLFCNIPVADHDDGITLQTQIIREGSPVAALEFTRQLEGTLHGKPYTHLVGIQYLFPLPEESFRERDIWSRDFPDVAAFFAEVEASPEFRAATTADLLGAVIVVDEPDEAATTSEDENAR